VKRRRKLVGSGNSQSKPHYFLRHGFGQLDLVVLGVFPLVVLDVQVVFETTNEYRTGSIEVSRSVGRNLLVFPKLLGDDVAGLPGLIDILIEFWADVVVKEVRQEALNRNGSQLDHVFVLWIEIERKE
jgi:hypothetical protein